MNFLIVTGLSGAGKSTVVERLEDIDFVCIDNMPPELVPAFGQIVQNSENDMRIAVCMDVRSGDEFGDMSTALERLNAEGVDYKILFIDCDDAILVRRFKETRRRHPLAKKYPTVEEAISAERKILEPVKARADYDIDTTHMSSKQLKERIAGLFLGNVEEALQVQCMSFGFKYGIPADADLVFDVRCMPNPFYIPELKPQTGLDKPVHDYVMDFQESKDFLQKLTDLIDFLLPLYVKEGKSELVIAFGCTGGKHRSVTFAQEMYQHLTHHKVKTTVIHRDIQKK